MSLAAENPRAVTFKPFRDTGYSVSAGGQVKAPRGNILKPKKLKDGYLSVALGAGNYYRIHRMVLIAFRGEPPSLAHETDHKNKVRDDNRLKNLRWVTKAVNLAHRNFAKGETHGCVKITESDVQMILAGPFYRGRDRMIAESLGICREHVGAIRRGKSWKHRKGTVR